MNARPDVKVGGRKKLKLPKCTDGSVNFGVAWKPSVECVMAEGLIAYSLRCIEKGQGGGQAYYQWMVEW